MPPDLSSMTLAEAEAWRAGWRAAIEQATQAAQAEADRWAEVEERDAEWSALGVRDAIRVMEPPA